jgi:glycosyltransferase involved in cell wall biosynthesis
VPSGGEDGVRFSVIVPTIDRPQLLSEAIESVLAQTVPDFEVIVVDSGCAVPPSLPDDERVRGVRLDENAGPAAARNAGVAAARGRYVCFLDDDDLYTPERLAIAATGLASAPVAVCWSRFVGQDVGTVRDLDGDVGDRILDGPTPSLGATAVRREALLPFDERWHAVEDVEWWLRTAQHTPVATVPEVGYLVRRHGGPRNRNDLPARLVENEAFIEAQADYLAAHRAARAFRLKRIGLIALAVGDRAHARSAFVRSLRARPRPETAWHLVRSAVPGR